jgi:hypothetical protein
MYSVVPICLSCNILQGPPLSISLAPAPTKEDSQRRECVKAEGGGGRLEILDLSEEKNVNLLFIYSFFATL